jgi:hypothetical protein
MTTLKDAAQQALNALINLQPIIANGLLTERQLAFIDPHLDVAIDALRAALAEPTLQTCNCRWDGEVQVQQCTLHEAHVDAIKEWAQRAKFAEKKLAALAEPVEPVAWLQPRNVDSYSRPDLGYETCSRSDYGGFPVYTAPPQRKPLTEEEIDNEANNISTDDPVQWWRRLARAVEQAHGIKEEK